jgi:dolichyl-phosphate beta-glucosyltransferase
MTRPPTLSVIIPALNEEHRLRSSLEAICGYFAARRFPTEILLVDDGSTDRTAEVASATQSPDPALIDVRVLKNEVNRGKGYSVRRGMLESRGLYALMTDADLSTPLQEFSKLEASVIDGNFHIGIGSRDIEGSQVEVHQSGVRENSGRLFNVFVRLFFPLPFRDTQCGFKLFSMQQCRRIFELQRLERFAFDVEILLIGHELGLAIDEVPVVWRHAEGSTLNFFRDGPKMLLDLTTIRWNALSGKYS